MNIKSKPFSVFSAVLLFLFSCTKHITAQTILDPGDLAFTGYCTDPGKHCSFIILRPGGIAASTTLYLTDMGYSTVTDALTPFHHDGVITINITALLPQFTEIFIQVNFGSPIAQSTQNSSGSFSSTGLNASVTSGEFWPEDTGDQLFLFQGSIASPTFITGIHMNNNGNGVSGQPPSTAATWDKIASVDGPTGWAITTDFSAIPPTLTNGVNAIMVVVNPGVSGVEGNYSAFKCAEATGTSLSDFRSRLMDVANWDIQDLVQVTVPTACAYSQFNTLPLNLLSFSAKATSTGVILHWTSANEKNVAGFAVERSTDKQNYERITNVPARANNSILQTAYDYTDTALTTGNIYYRLKMIDQDGRYEYSNTVTVNTTNRSNQSFSLYPNPVKGNVLNLIASFTEHQDVTLNIIDAVGRTWQKEKIPAAVLNTGKATILTASMPSGIYYLQIRNNKTGAVTLLKFRKDVP